MELNDFPTVDKVKEIISKTIFPKYENEVEINTYVELITNTLWNNFGDILPLFLVRQQHKELNWKFFRVRELETISNKNLIREYSYPPIELTKMGRCNFEKHPVFYCSNTPITALKETIKQDNREDKKYIISQWKMNNPENYLFVQWFMSNDLPVNNPYKKLNDNIAYRIKSPIDKNLSEEIEIDVLNGMIEYIDFLAREFLKDDYSVSAALAHNSLYAPHNARADILIYPSAQSNFTDINMALSPNFVENNLELTRLYLISATDINNGKFNLHEYADVDKNVIIWNNLNSLDKYKVHEILRDDFGEIKKTSFFYDSTSMSYSTPDTVKDLI